MGCLSYLIHLSQLMHLVLQPQGIAGTLQEIGLSMHTFRDMVKLRWNFWAAHAHSTADLEVTSQLRKTKLIMYGEIVQHRIRPSFDHQLLFHSSLSSSLSTTRLIRLLLPVFRHPVPSPDPRQSFPAPSSNSAEAQSYDARHQIRQRKRQSRCRPQG